MCNIMRPLTFLLSILFSQVLNGQADSTFHFKQVGWTIKVPPDLKPVDSATSAENIKAGKETVEGLMNQKVNMTKSTILISAAKDKFNYFGSTLTKSEAVTENNWLSADSLTKTIFYQAFSKLPNIKIDSSSTGQTIDGVTFQKLLINLNINDKFIVHANMMTTYYKGFYFGITSFYMDEKVGLEIEKMLRESRFDK